MRKFITYLFEGIMSKNKTTKKVVSEEMPVHAEKKLESKKKNLKMKEARQKKQEKKTMPVSSNLKKSRGKK